MQTYKITFHGYAIVTAENEDEAVQLFLNDEQDTQEIDWDTITEL